MFVCVSTNVSPFVQSRLQGGLKMYLNPKSFGVSMRESLTGELNFKFSYMFILPVVRHPICF